MSKLRHLMDHNREWAERIEREQPGVFETLSQGQAPELLWIGCADSRVPPNMVLDLPPGSIFVHRNIANQVVPGDLNCESVIQYAVQALKVKHIVVCGHYGCGGVAASLNEPSLGQIEGWLDHLRKTIRKHKDELEKSASIEEKQTLLCELNVIEQVSNVCNTPVVRDAWAAGQDLAVHGWIYRLEDGLLHDLGVSMTGNE